ncbi:trypsin-like serine protease [Methylobacter sp. S3L5C]|uniref:trypsin-like serine protease n=1 Tax=Methylobacter sp. S3L5C TaxID=2839024 RepID=UPI001FAB842B|nr:trypsin-like serine protease [Methylobacter sp. S3L5C]UOA08406.1 trypsin-like peptidase domain-containing protein [Methylobacter sp. S3L5C]
MIELNFSERNSQPYNNIGLIKTTWSDGSITLGTCSLVGRNDILTAGHCVFNPDEKGWATGFEFYFGADYNSNTGAFESWISNPTFSKWTANAWTSQIYSDGNNQTMLQSESQFDVALIGIDNPIGDTLGWLELDPGYNGNQAAIAVGYPVGSTGMMMQSASVFNIWDYGIYESLVEVMGAGSSGGPLLVGNSVIGVKSTGTWWADIGNSFVYNTIITELSQNNTLLNSVTTDTSGNDTLVGTSGDDLFDGGAGNDTVIFNFNKSAVTEIGRSSDGNTLMVKSLEGTDTLLNIENLSFLDANLSINEFIAQYTPVPLFSSSASDGTSSYVMPAKYTGPVTFLEYELLGKSTGDVIIGSTGNDFMNLLAGDDAANGGAGNDVLDGGTGSNFLTGGSGNDTIFLDGRGGSITWSTVTDFSVGDQINIWGWNNGVSKQVFAMENQGADGYKGATYHYDLNNDRLIDTSITLTGLALSQIPTGVSKDVAGNGYLFIG